MKRSALVLALAVVALSCKDGIGPETLQNASVSAIQGGAESATVRLTANTEAMWYGVYGETGNYESGRYPADSVVGPSKTFDLVIRGRPGIFTYFKAYASKDGVTVPVTGEFRMENVFLTVSPETATVDFAGSLRFTARFSSRISNEALDWRTTVGTIDSTGLLTGFTGPATGTVTICSRAYPDVCSTATVTVVRLDLIAFFRMEDTLTASRCYGAPCQEIFLMNRDGSNQRRITTTPWFADGTPNWSPDGRKIAFFRAQMGTEENPGVIDIFTMNQDGSDLRNVTRGQASQMSSLYPAWSPDGRRIAFTYIGATAGIGVIDTSGTNLRRLTTIPCSTGCTLDGTPTWSPDGRWITFSGHDGHIWKMDTLGQNLQPLTQTGINIEPVWLPDGSGILYVYSLSGWASIWQIYLMNPDGSNPRRITSETFGAIEPTVSRDGRELNYTCLSNEIIQFPGNGGTTENWDICSISIDGTGRTNLTQTPNLFERWPARRP